MQVEPGDATLYAGRTADSEDATMTVWTLHAGYDDEARVWYTLSCDVPGLVTEGETLERLRERAAAVLPELLEDNAHLIAPDRRAGPHSLHLVAFHESTVPVLVGELLAA